MQIRINSLDELEQFIETADISKEQLLDIYRKATKNYFKILITIYPPNDEDDEDYTGNVERDTKQTIIKKIKLGINGIRTGRPYVFMYCF